MIKKTENNGSAQHPYQIARNKKLAEFEATLNPDRLRLLGAEVGKENVCIIPLLRWQCRLQWRPFSLSLLPEESKLDMISQVLILDYLTSRQPKNPTRLVSFADFSEGRGYLKPFEGRVIQRLNHTAGASQPGFVDAAVKLGGEQAGSDPVRFLFRFFPLFEMQIVRHEADEDFPHNCNILFSDNANEVLSVESLIVCAEKLVATLEKGKL